MAIGFNPIGAFKPIEPIAPINNNINNVTNKQDDSLTGGFKDLLERAIAAVNQTGNQSDADALTIMTGQNDAPHNVLISTEEASIALDLTLAIRTKVIDAYNEIMRMQV